MAVSRTESELASLQAEIGGAYVAASLDDEAGCRHLIEATRAQLGPISILVNNAGDGDATDGRIWEIPAADWRAKLAVNIDAPFHLTRLSLPDMLAAGHGRIVNIASTAGLIGGAGMTTFVTSKHALVGMTRAVALDAGGSGVTCNAVCPGWVRTSATEATEQVWAERAACYPGQRVVTVEEVASLVVYLAGDSASGVNGEAIRVALGSTW
jgi:NAD(P)-dependent dehydrogenase (short-subunit alcohol dehydrogenase family)